MAQRPASTTLSSSNFSQFLGGFDNFLFDCDGVLWQGDVVVPGAVAALEFLRTEKKRIVFVTNNSTTARAAYKKKLNSFGIQAEEEEIFNSGYAAAVYLKSIGFNKKAYLIGEQGLGDEFERNGIAYRGVREHAFIPANAKEAAAHLVVDPEIGAVVVGLDRAICYPKLAFAHYQLTHNEGCIFVATNTDETLPCEHGQLPGGGVMVQMVQTVLGRPPVAVCGKPSILLLDLIVDKYSMDRSRTIMVGDRLSTDIAWGQAGSISTLLVLTGVNSRADVEDPQNKIFPTFITKSVGDFVDFK